jgi:hypothetical protein
MTRRILWFATAYTIVIIIHEAAHAFVARAAGLEVELFNFWASIDPQNHATTAQRAAFGSAGPVSSLVVGLMAWLAYRAVSRSRAAMPLLFLAACGVSNFFGNLMSAAFIGDFSNVATWMGLPMSVRYAASAVGAIGVALVLFATGRQIARWVPPQPSRLAAVLTGVIVPVAIGTALIILVNQPAPIPGFVAARVGESVVWIFAAAGMWTAARASSADGANSRLHWIDGVIAVLVLVIVRVMTTGIPLSA